MRAMIKRPSVILLLAIAIALILPGEVLGEPDTWEQWSKHVLTELDRLSGEVKSLNDKLGTSKEDIIGEISKLRGDVQGKMEEHSVAIGKLNVKSTIYGALGGMIPMVIGIMGGFIYYRRNGKVINNGK